MFSYSKDLNFDVVLPSVKATHKRQVYKMGSDALAKHIGASSALILARLQDQARLSRACAGDGVEGALHGFTDIAGRGGF
jgi:hypothetical protein